MHFLLAKSASLGVFDREFRGKEQQEKPRVREFRELWIASLRGLSVLPCGLLFKLVFCYVKTLQWLFLQGMS